MEYKIPRKRIKVDAGVEWEAPKIEFRMIGNDGNEESIITGQAVGSAPPWRGQSADWVRPVRVEQDHEEVLPEMVRVVTVTKRHQCGKATRSGRVVPGAGRYVDPGEMYSCPATREADRVAWQDHFARLRMKVIPGGELEPWEFDRLSGVNDSEMMCT